MTSQKPPTSSNRIDTLTLWIALASLVVSTISIVFSYWAFDVSKRAEGRASGKIKATFEDLGIFPTEREHIPDGIKTDFLDGIHVFSINNLRDFMEWGPSVKVKNTGEYPIDSLHVDVLYVQGGMVGEGVKQIEPKPVLGTGISSLEPPLFGKLDKGKFAVLTFQKQLLDQMLKATLGEQFKDKRHFGVFEVRTFCRIVGATSYDRPDRPEFPRFGLVWTPSQLDEDNKKLILGSNPQVFIMDK
jgi:hypothetical protein